MSDKMVWDFFMDLRIKNKTWGGIVKKKLEICRSNNLR